MVNHHSIESQSKNNRLRTEISIKNGLFRWIRDINDFQKGKVDIRTSTNLKIVWLISNYNSKTVLPIKQFRIIFFI